MRIKLRESEIMKKKKMITDIIGEEIEKYGFVYGLEKAYSGSSMWGFTREVNGIKQRIRIQHHRFMQALFLDFSTSAWGQSMGKRAGKDLKISEKYNHYFGQWSYENEDDFKSVLLEFLDIIENYGLKELGEMSVEPEIIPTNEMGEKLISAYESLSENFIEQNQIQDLHMTLENVSKWFELIENKFEQTKNLPYNDVKDMLLEVVAFLGEQLRKELNGKWQLGYEPRIVALVELKSRGLPAYTPLQAVVEAWSNSDISKFKSQYLTFLKNKI